MSLNRYISIDPKICGGAPCIKGHRIPVYMILELVGAGMSSDEIHSRCYPQVSSKAINAAVTYAARVLQTGRTYPIARA
ncbi:MAG: DUF433 domain-containing protein [Elusimicrobiota bacterium]